MKRKTQKRYREILAELKGLVDAHGATSAAKWTGIERTHFYRMFSPKYGNPSFSSVMTVAEAFGYRLVLRPITREEIP